MTGVWLAIYVMSLIFETIIKLLRERNDLFMNVMTSNIYTHFDGKFDMFLIIKFTCQDIKMFTGWRSKMLQKLVFYWPMFNRRIKYENVWLPKRTVILLYDMNDFNKGFTSNYFIKILKAYVRMSFLLYLILLETNETLATENVLERTDKG